MACVLVTAGLTSCSNRDAPRPAAEIVHATSAQVGAAGVRLDTRRHSPDFASLPDRGVLVRYAPSGTRESGAYTWHPIQLSEDHALSSVAGRGDIQLQSPDGAPIRLSYERHVEHPDGNWTWIGRGHGGSDGVITFGEKAVFGVIHHADKVLRIRTQGGQAWLVAGAAGVLPDPEGLSDDTLIPPEVAAPQMERSQPVAGGAESSSVPTVDLVLGFTTGFAQSLGGDSQARTRLNNLVEITNQAYSNSRLVGRVRLVHAMAVNFPDASANKDTLEKLSGYRSGAGFVGADPAFTALRSARETYGADLVSLVRKFSTPENDGCGIAWLIGGNQSGVDSWDEPFGYSVVSDGTDVNEGDGKTYFCREETLAHELGHNMGQTHNSEDASSPGVHPYSYGYRQSTADGFYTVMAYRLTDSRQRPIRYFSNPAVTVEGVPTGVAGSSDNVRSLTEVLPTVASFRPTRVIDNSSRRSRLDINADGRADLFWSNRQWSSADWWLLDGTSWTYGEARYVSGQYRVAGRGDFDGDGRSDVLWEDGSTLWLWRSEPLGGFSIHFVSGFPSGWTIAGVGDINGDGRDDIFWSNRAAQMADWWLMDGSRWTYGVSAYVATQYRVAGLGDFDGDGRADVLWEDGATLWLWRSEASGGFSIRYVANYPAGWDVAGIGDINSDGRDDVFWSNRSLEAADWWLMNGTSWAYGGGARVPRQFQVAGLGDFDGDGRADVLWEDGATLWIWRSEIAGGFSPRFLANYPSGWKPYL